MSSQLILSIVLTGGLMRNFKMRMFNVLIIVIAGLLPFLAENPIFNLQLFERDLLNSQVNYQLSALIVTAFVLLLIYLFADKLRLSYLKFKREGVMQAAFLIPSEEGRWESDGRFLGLIMVGIMGAMTVFQTYQVGYDFD